MNEVIDYGHFEMKIEECLREKGISKNALAEQASLQRTQLNNYCKNNIKRPDFDVLARICYALDCELADIVSYVKPQNRNGGNDNG